MTGVCGEAEGSRSEVYAVFCLSVWAGATAWVIFFQFGFPDMNAVTVKSVVDYNVDQNKIKFWR